MYLTKTFLDELTFKINGACIEVHKQLGPGLLESIYHKCLKREFELRGIKFSCEIKVPIFYKGFEIEGELRYDFLIEDSIILELKSIEILLPVHQAQTLTYMKLLEKPKGILVNFNVSNIMKEDQQTFVNELFRSLPE